MKRLLISTLVFAFFPSIGIAKADVLEDTFPLSPTLHKLLIYDYQSNHSSTCVLNGKSIDFGLLFGPDHRELNRLELQIYFVEEGSSINKKVRILGSTLTTRNAVEIEFVSSSEIILDLIKKWTEPPTSEFFLITEDQSCAKLDNKVNLVTNLRVIVIDK